MGRIKNKWIEYENVERAAGRTTWNFWGLVRYAYTGFLAFATTPLRGVIYLGMIVVIISIAMAIRLYISALRTPYSARTGYSSIMILILFLGGVIITILGMMENIWHVFIWKLKTGQSTLREIPI